MKKRRRRRRSPPKVSRYRRVVGRLSHSMVSLAVVTVGLTFGLASVGWAVNGKPLLAGNTNTATRPTVLENTGTGPALELHAASGPALAVNTDGLVTNLNADKLDGMGEEAFAKDGHKHSGGDINSGTVGEPFIDAAITRDSELDSNMNQLRSSLQQADQAPNEPGDPVDWTNLKGVPQGFADGEDAVGSSDPNAGLSGYEIVEVSSAFNTGGQKSAQADCPSGKEVTGGGGAFSSSENGLGAGGNEEIAIQWSRPFQFSSQSGYSVVANDMSTSSASSFSWRVIAYAICADVTSP
jgi:hypothetical protein